MLVRSEKEEGSVDERVRFLDLHIQSIDEPSTLSDTLEASLEIGLHTGVPQRGDHDSDDVRTVLLGLEVRRDGAVRFFGGFMQGLTLGTRKLESIHQVAQLGVVLGAVVNVGRVTGLEGPVVEGITRDTLEVILLAVVLPESDGEQQVG
jgi:hypothetical protein